MLDTIHARLRSRPRLLFTLALLTIFFLFLFEPLNIYLAESLHFGYGFTVFTVLSAFYLFFRGPRDGWEQRLLILYAAWVAVTRVINGDVVMLEEGWRVAQAGLMFCFTGLGLLLDRPRRRRVLLAVGVVLSVFYTALALPALYAYISGRTLYYPLTQSVFGRIYGYRLDLLGYNPNISAVWYLLSTGMLLYLFFRCRSRARLWRVPIVLALLIAHCAIAATHCRNVELAFAGCAGLLAVLLGLRFLRRPKGAAKVLLLVFLFLLTVPLCYKSFDVDVALMARVNTAVRTGPAAAEPAPAAARESTAVARTLAGRASAAPAALRAETEEPAAPTPTPEQDGFSDIRPLGDDSERLLIYRTLPEVFRREPLRLLRGCLFNDRMTISNSLLPQEKGAMHNSWLEILNYLGLPGFLLIAAYCVLLLRACFRLFFSRDPAHDLSLKCLVLPILGTMSYSMLETLLFFRIDVRSLLAYLLMGVVIAESRERADMKS